MALRVFCCVNAGLSRDHKTLRSSITTDGGDATSWLNLQQAYDLKVTGAKVAKRIADEIQPLEHA